jgi:hypothetical protein
MPIFSKLYPFVSIKCVMYSLFIALNHILSIFLDHILSFEEIYVYSCIYTINTA